MSTPHPSDLERMLPREIRAAIARRAIAYLPLGALEWHGEHLPVGLDCLTARGLCRKAAERTGGLVFPPLAYGMWATIWNHPWTILAEEEEALRHLLEVTLSRLDTFGVRLAVVFTGHFATRQLDLLGRLERDWNGDAHTLKLLRLSISELPASPIPPDHGALFETSVLSSLEPDLVRLDRLHNVNTHPANDPEGDPYGPHRRDPDDVLFGILGRDPRELDPLQASQLTQALVDWIVGEVESAWSLLPS